MAEIIHQLTIKASSNRVYQALTEQKGLAGWWTQYVSAEPRLDSVAQFTFEGGKLVVRMKIIKLFPNRTIVWHCLAGHPEWIGTQIAFELQAEGKDTLLTFSHRGWRSAAGFYAKSNFEWARNLLSLRAYLEKGKGYPARQ